MLTPSEEYRVLPTFALAAELAKQAANILGEETVVKSTSDGWLVLLPPGGRYELSRISLAYAASSSDVIDQEPMSVEFSSDQDDYQRSEDDGWFYED